jgi:purine-nucleoside phosphorylase
MLELFNQIEEATAKIRGAWQGTPRAGIILGTGLGGLAEEIDVQATIDYEDIPHFPQSTALSHRGRLVCGELAGVPVMAMEGRCRRSRCRCA